MYLSKVTISQTPVLNTDRAEHRPINMTTSVSGSPPDQRVINLWEVSICYVYNELPIGFVAGLLWLYFRQRYPTTVCLRKVPTTSARRP